MMGSWSEETEFPWIQPGEVEANAYFSLDLSAVAAVERFVLPIFESSGVDSWKIVGFSGFRLH